MTTFEKYGHLVGSIDQGSSSTRFSMITGLQSTSGVFKQDRRKGCIPSSGIGDPHTPRKSGEEDHKRSCIRKKDKLTITGTYKQTKGYFGLCDKQERSHKRWIEMDATWILESTRDCMERTAEKLHTMGIHVNDVKCIGITNQMLTVILWDRVTGKPLCNAIVYSDTRAHDRHQQLESVMSKDERLTYQKESGMPFNTIFLPVKLPWLLENNTVVKEAFNQGRLLTGTVNTWLLWTLTGGPNGGRYMTDVTNACHTGLMNLNTLTWDVNTCSTFNIPTSILPAIHSTSEVYGYVKEGPFQGIPLSGMIGDQPAATTGQLCFKPGESKCTYGTVASLNINTGTKVISEQFAGEELARSVEDTDDCYFVPALEGFFCPYWTDDARGVICGLNMTTTKAHICRAALESICFQVRKVLEIAADESGFPIPSLKADGGMVVNTLFMQMQADILGENVVSPVMKETTSFGAALMAGAATGIDVFRITNDRLGLEVEFPQKYDVFEKSCSTEVLEKRLKRWEKAVQKSFDWMQE